MTVENFDAASNVTVIGAGPCGSAFAADLASRGKSVMLYGHPDHRGSLPMIEKNGGWLNAEGDGLSGRFQIQTTSDMYLAIRHSQFLVSTVPSYGQDTILRTLSQFNLQNHTLIINVGNFFYLAARQRVNCHSILETDISPYAVRITGDTVFIKGVKKALTIWAEPLTAQGKASSQQVELAFRRQVESIFSQRLLWCQNLLQVGLNNINPVVHCPAAIMNTGWIEATKGDFYFYAQGMSPTVSKFSEKVDEERVAIGRAYGFELDDITTYMNKNYQNDREYSNYHEFATGSVIHNKTKSAPTNMNHRYLLEDILYGMVPWYEVGLKCGLPSPTIKLLIDMASTISGFDYFEHGRSLKASGLADASKEQILLALGGPVDNTPKMIAPLSEALVNAPEAPIALQQPQVAA